MRRPAVLALLALSACATPRAEKMSFEELYATSGDSGSVSDSGPFLPHEPERAPGPLAPERSPELDAALSAFTEKARAYREKVQRGSVMPAEQARNWEAMNAALDAFLSRPVERTDSRDLTRARGVLEAELEQDARLYGDMPGPLAEAVVLRVGRLIVRASTLRRWELPPEPSGPPRLAWPVEPVTITSLYGERWHPITGQLRRHLGVDLAARRGQVVAVAEKGVVLRAGWNGDHGQQVEVLHAGQWVTRYSHLSQVLVTTGEVLTRGDAVGLAGDTGLATGVHVHFELWHDGNSLDPLEALVAPELSPEAPEQARPVAHQLPESSALTSQGRHPTAGSRP
ncbi:M23 family metallopeptidase [Corallococcus llansteffanensis]|uniref:M23 family metallopeptidase n=1 Tax=Corallococcus llansteffanensis TaxID=2316731 RepID=A0A3A8PHS8_9BACT|nr:M23 family metallopeptidase [Corallococcus llansteffanensis]RKH52062.1 M23 family metallopeptidase [Corallococcus llansteffanensis]